MEATDAKWILRVTNVVPFANRGEYESKTREVIAMFREMARVPGDRRHIASYRVAFGNALEYMHLFEFDSLAAWEQWPPNKCDTIKAYYDNRGQNIVTESRYEWLRPLPNA